VTLVSTDGQRHGAALLVGNAGDARLEAQRIADHDGSPVGEALFAVQHLLEVGAEHVEEFEGLFGVHHFQTKEIGRRHRYCGVAGGFRGAGIRVGRDCARRASRGRTAAARVRHVR
jgi:hypothetical protein